jgi:hypothetical protein
MLEGAWVRADVSDWPIRRVEQIGSTQNLWLLDRSTGQEWLHKDTVIPSNGIEQGEDWAEVMSTRVAMELGVPCATTRLCIREGRRGSLSLSVIPEAHDLWEGPVVLEASGASGYFRHVEGEPGIDPDRPGVRRPGHNLPNIREALGDVGSPLMFGGPATLTGFDVFAGYVLLDALIANRDRHEQNWAILAPRVKDSRDTLAPSYDHASSLGYNLTDERRRAFLAAPERLVAWAEKGTAYRFEHSARPESLVAHAMNALALSSRQGADWWAERIHGLRLQPLISEVLEEQVPDVSPDAARFACELLELNAGRLRDALRDR